jgi:membrane-associated phospholipid phosphatase
VVSVAFLIRYDILPILLPLILIAGLIGTSRLILTAHKPSQIYSGFVLGFFSSIFVFVIFHFFAIL